MVCHVVIHHGAEFSVPPGFRGVVYRFVETERAAQPRFGQSLEVTHCSRAVHLQGEQSCIGRDYEIIFKSQLQSKSGNAEGVVLIDLVGVQRSMSGFGNPPWDTAFLTIANL